MARDAIRLEGVAFRYAGERREIAALAFEEGRITFVLGKSGGGKTTLLSLLSGLARPLKGRVLVEGRTLAPDAVWKTMGFLLQEGALFAWLNAVENVLCPMVYHPGQGGDGPPLERARALLKKVGLEDREHSSVATLSGGEKKRLALARALALRPRLLLADEPSSGLDPASAARISALLREHAASGGTAVVVTHDFAAARALAGPEDRFLVVSNGLPSPGPLTLEGFLASDDPAIREYLAALRA